MTLINKTAFYITVASMTVLIGSCSDSGPTRPENVAPARVTEARQYIYDQIVHGPASDIPVKFKVFSRGESYIKSVTITPTKIRIATENPLGSEGKDFAFSLKELTPGRVCDDSRCLVSVIRSGGIASSHYVSYEFSFPNIKIAPKKADNLTYALQTLQDAALQLRSDDPSFRKVVDSYRSASPKPELPEDASRLNSKAEEAAKNNRYNDAVDEYAQALEIAPWWAQGHFNLAVNMAEAKDYKGATDYEGAIDEMKCYLMLAPDAGDAQIAKDKIKAWDKKIHQPKWYKF